MSVHEQLDRVHALVDGELGDAEAEQLRLHLVDCAECQRELQDVLQLGALGRELADDAAQVPARLSPLVTAPVIAAPVIAAAPVVDLSAAREKRKPRRVLWAAAASGLAAAAALLFALRPTGDGDLYALGESRPLEVRLTHAGASEWRRYDVVRAAGPAAATVPLAALAQLEQRGDLQGVATGYLLRGERVQAAATLERAPQSADVKSDRAAAALVGGAPDEALALLDEVLQANPNHPQAAWNRGLALRELGLQLAAAEAFEQVAKLAESGWSTEASARAAALRNELRDQEKAWHADDDAGKAMVTGGAPLSPESARRHPGISRVYFYDAVRAAPSAERVRALAGLAAQLDQVAGGEVLKKLVERVAGADFGLRAPLAADYARLFSRQLDAAAAEKLLARLRSAGQPDLLFGAILQARGQGLSSGFSLEEYRRLADESGDPWFRAIAGQEQAQAVIARQPLDAERALTAALHGALQAHLDYRATLIALRLAELYADLHRVTESWALVQQAFSLARAGQEWIQQRTALAELATTSRLRWSYAVARSYLRELLLRAPDHCPTQAFVHESLADLAERQLRLAEARREFDQSPLCGAPMALEGAVVLADLARLQGAPGDGEKLRAALAGLRDSGTLSPGQRAFTDYIEGRFLLEKDRVAGRKLLEASISAADALPADVQAVKTRAYSYSTLALDDARAGEWGRALEALAAEQHVQVAPSCVVGVAVDDERSLLAVRGANGQDGGTFEGARKEAMEKFAPRLSPAQAEALRGCAVVDVLARPPLQGRAGLLPPEIAWRYRVTPAVVHPSSLPGRALVVSDASPPASLGLARLDAWSKPGHDERGRVELSGAAATPSRVLGEMGTATEIEIHAHGFVDLGLSDASLIALSPEPGGERGGEPGGEPGGASGGEAAGSWALSAAQIRKQRLAGNPLVLLAACHAATGAAQFHAPWSLPVAFLEAGARAVLASPAEIPDAQARGFFDAVEQRVRGGQEPAAALRDERMTFRARTGGQWVDVVLLFE